MKYKHLRKHGKRNAKTMLKKLDLFSKQLKRSIQQAILTIKSMMMFPMLIWMQNQQDTPIHEYYTGECR